MNQNIKTVKPDPHGDAIGHIDYVSEKFENTAIAVVGIALAFLMLIGMVNMITGSLSRSVSLVLTAIILVCLLYVLFRGWPALTRWFNQNLRFNPTFHWSMVFVGAVLGVLLIGMGGH